MNARTNFAAPERAGSFDFRQVKITLLRVVGVGKPPVFLAVGSLNRGSLGFALERKRMTTNDLILVLVLLLLILKVMR